MDSSYHDLACDGTTQRREGEPCESLAAGDGGELAPGSTPIIDNQIVPTLATSCRRPACHLLSWSGLDLQCARERSTGRAPVPTRVCGLRGVIDRPATHWWEAAGSVCSRASVGEIWQRQPWTMGKSLHPLAGHSSQDADDLRHVGCFLDPIDRGAESLGHLRPHDLTAIVGKLDGQFLVR